MITSSDLQLLTFTLMMSTGGVLLAAGPAILLAYWSADRQTILKNIVDALATLPLAMPPVAVGLFLLQLLSKESMMGQVLETINLNVVFTWKAVLIALSVMSFPLIFRPCRSGFESIDRRYKQLGRSLGRSPLSTFISVMVPLAGRSIIAGLLLGLSRALGEFGCTIILAGNIPGETRTLATGIFHRFQMGHDTGAIRLALMTAVLTLLLIFISNALSESRHE